MRIPLSTSPRNTRIIGASLIAVLMVAGGYFLPGSKFPKTKAVNAELTDELLASYVAKDTDGDGLPDWQESLYGTDLNKADTDGDGISDGEAVRKGLLTPTALASQLPSDPIGEDEVLPGQAPAAGSLTEQFSRSFFEKFMEASGGQTMTAEDQEALIQELLADFGARAAATLDSRYTRVSAHTSTSISATTYAGSVEQVLRSHDVPQGYGEPLPLMTALMKDNDESAREKLRVLGKSYAAISADLLALSVPPALVDTHIELVRSFDTLAKSTNMVVNYEKDPIGVIGSLTVYPSASSAILEKLKAIASAVLNEGEPASGTSGALIVNTARSLEQ